MPPASLSTFAVMNPGPTTARNNRIRVFQLLKNFMRAFHRHMDGTGEGRIRINADVEYGQIKSGAGTNEGSSCSAGLHPFAQHTDHVVGGDYSCQFAVI